MSSYSAPALEKGLDILELLAGSPRPMSTAAIAEALERSRNEIFRMLTVLEARGFIERSTGDEGFVLTSRLLELAMRNPPQRTLLDVALPVMERLSERCGQSCHLAVPSGGEMVVIARIESPADVGFAVRIGHRRRLVESTSGRVLLAFQPKERRASWLSQVEGSLNRAELDRDLEKIARRGYRRAKSSYVTGIVDLGAPVFDGRDSGAIAALTIPCVQRRGSTDPAAAALEALLEASAEVSSSLAADAGRGDAVERAS